MHIEAIFLGLDVLVDLEAQQLSASNAAFERAGLSLRWTLATLRNHARANGNAMAISAALPVAFSTTDKERLAALVASRDALLLHAVEAQAPSVRPACMALIDDALAAGCKVSILSDMPSALTALLLEQCFGHEASSKLAVVAGGQHFGSRDPTGPYVRALQAIGIESEHALLIDVAGPSLTAARAAGIATRSLAPRAAATADLACPRLHDLTTPYYRHAA
jgi:beta-phosphoglucomutase